MRIPSAREPVTPGEILLEEFLKPAGVTQKDFAAHLGWTQARLNDIIRGKRSLSYEKALDLEDATGMPAYFWMELQMRFELYHARNTHQKISKMSVFQKTA